MATTRIVRRLFGADPRALAWFLLPTALAFVVDLVLRAGLLAGYALQGKAIYLSSWLVSAAFWTLPQWGTARLAVSKVRAARIASGLLYVFVFWPLAAFSFGGQVLYHRVVHAYMGRDTVRLGFALRGTVAEWFAAWGSGLALAAMIASGLVITIGLRAIALRIGPRLVGPAPLLPIVTFVAALVVFWVDLVDSRFLQAALPDDCFVHGVVHACRVGITGQGKTRHGISLRTPVKLPPLESVGAKPNVIVILTESVRADAICSDPSACKSRFLDEVIPDRLPLGKLTTPSSGTFGSCVLLWTGLPATANVDAAHSAPVLWELARAVGYRTAYVTSQNTQFENFGAFMQNAGIDTLVTAVDLGGLRQEQLGAPDERATARMLEAFRARGDAPFFGVLHFSNTHAPYRVDADLQPNEPHSPNPVGDVVAFHNHYLNSVLLQERTVSAFLGELRRSGAWDDTVVVFLSDHGEEFRERGGLYHLHSLFDEEVRIPGFVAGGSRALTEARRTAVATFAGKRTYLADVNATVVDLFGLAEQRPKLPFANVHARSMVGAQGWRGEPLVIMSTTTAVWEQDDAKTGVMLGEHLLVGPSGSPLDGWACYDIARDPEERTALAASKCPRRMFEAAQGQQ